ncbi:MAG: energy transducer TonB [Chitinophagaceae bacterium]|nr:energy transducer TonB [Chitinophagaceae bacterium]
MKKTLLAIIYCSFTLVAYCQPDTLWRKQLDSALQMLDISELTYPYEDIPPYYPGGENRWFEYLTRSTILHHAIEKAREKNIPAGTYPILVTFTVNTDGSLSNIKTLSKKAGYGLDEAAVKLVKESGKWIPANINNRVTKSQLNFPVYISIEAEDVK